MQSKQSTIGLDYHKDETVFLQNGRTDYFRVFWQNPARHSYVEVNITHPSFGQSCFQVTSIMSSSSQPLIISSALFDVYQKYKTSTASVLKWLSDNGAIASHSGVTVNQLQQAAERAHARNITAPEQVYRDFRDSLANRRKVTNWFSSTERAAGAKTSQSTLNHTHFMET
jgi:hypothetical protein